MADIHAYITEGDYVTFRDNLPSYLFTTHRPSKYGLPSCIRGVIDNDYEIGKNTKFLVERVVNNAQGVIIVVGGCEQYWDISLFDFAGLVG